MINRGLRIGSLPISIDLKREAEFANLQIFQIGYVNVIFTFGPAAGLLSTAVIGSPVRLSRISIQGHPRRIRGVSMTA
jgi:hypothetical protein